MSALKKLLIVTGIGALVGGVVSVLARKRTRGERAPIGGSMSVGAVDEVELAGPMGSDPDVFDVEKVPSEHVEINDLRDKGVF